MAERLFDLIGVDGDDTLWHNERDYVDARERFRGVIERCGVALPDHELTASVNRTELQNIPFYGYGVSSFVLSLIETAIGLTGGRIQGSDISELLKVGKSMLTSPVELFEGAREALAALAPDYPLALITKGDLLHQRSKLDRSGLGGHFRHVEVVSHKTPEVYRAILGRYGVEPSKFLMVGNSPRSDVLPVLEIGGWAAHVPAALSWSHEEEQLSCGKGSRCVVLGTLLDLPAAVHRWGPASAADRAPDAIDRPCGANPG
jgi:putative hydrolase of the HAD superfamily